MRLSQQERRAHLSLWRESGLSMAAYCREASLNYQTFLYWVRADKQSTETPKMENESDDSGSDFVKIIDKCHAVAESPATLFVCLHDGKMQFTAQAPASWVAAVIREVAAC